MADKQKSATHKAGSSQVVTLGVHEFAYEKMDSFNRGFDYAISFAMRGWPVEQVMKRWEQEAIKQREERQQKIVLVRKELHRRGLTDKRGKPYESALSNPKSKAEGRHE